MRWLMAATVGFSLVSPSLAAEQAPSNASVSQSVLTYPASFFATMGLNTAYDMIQRIPGFTLDDGSAVRGFADAAGNVLIDGQRPASKTDDLARILVRIPVSNVERIDLIRGGAPGIDMQGKSVVANVITRKLASAFNGVAVVGAYKPEAVPFDPQIRLEGTWHDGDRTFGVSLFAARFHDGSQGGGEHIVFGPDGHRLDVASMSDSGPMYQYIGTTNYETTLFGGKFKANLTLEDQPSQVIDIDNSATSGRTAEHDRQDRVDAEFGQHYERGLGDDLSFEVLGLEHVDHNGAASVFSTATDLQDFNLSSHGGEAIGRGILHWRPSDLLTVDGGGEFAYNWLSTRTRFIDNGVAIQVPAANVLVQEKRGEIFANATWQVFPTLSVQTQLRVEQSTISSTGDVVLSKDLTFLKPRLLATWSPDALDQLRVRIEREVGQLDFQNFVANAALNGVGVIAGNPNLVPQRDWAFEAAYDRHFWDSGVASLTYRHLVLQDVVDRVPVFAPSGVFDEPGNIGGGTEDDIVASFSLPLDRIGLAHAVLRGTGTWRVSSVTDPTTGGARIISGQDPFDSELHFTQDFPAWKLNWGVDFFPTFYNRFYRFDEIDTNRNGSAATVFVEYKPLPDLSLRATLDTNRQVFDVTRQVFAGPRNVDPLLVTDFRGHRFGVISFFRIRKTFS
ncbi:MAG TPA: TonB-dependent receptor plug domain-containing protein [Rhizomicrobium sp.]